MKSTARFDARAARDKLLSRAVPTDEEIIRFTFRPFDNRWLYWEREGLRLDRPRPDYRPHVFEGNLWLSAAQHLRKGADEPQACFSTHMGSLHLIERTALMFPAWLRDDGMGNIDNGERRANLSASAQRYLDHLGLTVEDLFHHVLAVLHDPEYRETNAGALRMDWPRIPLPDWPNGGTDGVAVTLARSAARGRHLAALLDPDTSIPGLTQAPLRPEAATVAVPTTVSGRNMAGEHFDITAGWGHYGEKDAVMPGRGRTVERPYTSDERTAVGDALSTLGDTTFDVYLNDAAYWRNVPAAAWNYRMGGYQVLKKWLSYRETRHPWTFVMP